METEEPATWHELVNELVVLTRRFERLLHADEEVAGLLRRATLVAYAQHQATDPAVRALIDEAVAELEVRLSEGQPYETARPVEEVIAQARQVAEELRQQRAAG